MADKATTHAPCAHRVPVSSIELRPYRPEMATEASLMLARAFASNPVHLAAFGESVLAQNDAFFRTVLPLLNGFRAP